MWIHFQEFSHDFTKFFIALFAKREDNSTTRCIFVALLTSRDNWSWFRQRHVCCHEKYAKKSVKNVKKSIWRNKTPAQPCLLQQHRRMATRKRLWYWHLPLVMWDICTKLILLAFRNFCENLREWYDWFSCRSNTNAREKCPVSTTDLRICTMASWSACPVVPKQISGLGRNQGETHTLNYLSVATHSQREDVDGPEGTQRSKDFLSIHGEDLAACKSLMIDNRSEFKSYDYKQMQRRMPIIAGIYCSGPSSYDHLWRACVPW